MSRGTSGAPFAVRLAHAHRMLEHGRQDAPVHLADQLDAAGRDTQRLHDRLGVLLPALMPDRPWFQRQDRQPATEARAYLLAALLGCLGSVCPHLKRAGPQPAIGRLPLRRVDCARCLGTIRRPPPDDVDRCDVCERRGVVTFSPFAVRQGPLLLLGDVCQPCAGTLGIRIEQEAS